MSLKHFKHSTIPFCGFIWAIVGLPILYITAISYDHVQPVVPYVSTLGIYPPEKYMFQWLFTIYLILATFSQCLWCSKLMQTLTKRYKSKVPILLTLLVGLIMIVSGMCILGLTYIDTKEDNRSHYHLTLLNFTCHILAMTISVPVIIVTFDRWLFFSTIRLLLLIQMMFAAIGFTYYNRIGLDVLQAKDFYYIKSYEPGYEEFKWSAISEWFIVLGCAEFTLIMGLEIKEAEKFDHLSSHKFKQDVQVEV
ncbi:unnamed protein product [Heterobilharzia americana]|nr:unnamed protein product [Heterobilharzia americana]